MAQYFRTAVITCSNCSLEIPKRRKPCSGCGVIPLIPKPAPRRSWVPKPAQPSQRRWADRPDIDLPVLSDRSKTFVYLITDGTYCKIGFAKSLAQRFTALQNATPHALSLLDAIETSEPRMMEKFLHGLFARKHHRLEWFKLITIREWEAAVETAKELIETTISSGISSAQQDQLNTGSN